MFRAERDAQRIAAAHAARRSKRSVTVQRKKSAPGAEYRLFQAASDSPFAPALEKRIREALAAPGRRGVRVIAKQFGVDPGTVQRISRPFESVGVVVA
jgi:hypothetical protein